MSAEKRNVYSGCEKNLARVIKIKIQRNPDAIFFQRGAKRLRRDRIVMREKEGEREKERKLNTHSFSYTHSLTHTQRIQFHVHITTNEIYHMFAYIHFNVYSRTELLLLAELNHPDVQTA